LKEATSDALHQASTEFLRNYTPDVGGKALKVNNMYDEITDTARAPSRWRLTLSSRHSLNTTPKILNASRRRRQLENQKARSGETKDCDHSRRAIAA